MLHPSHILPAAARAVVFSSVAVAATASDVARKVELFAPLAASPSPD